MENHERGKRRTFSAEYKAEAVRLVSDSGKSIGVIARNWGWVRQLCGAGYSSPRLMLGEVQAER